MYLERVWLNQKLTIHSLSLCHPITKTRTTTRIKADKDELLKFIKQCQHKTGGISASIGHDPHLLYTLSAIQVLVLLDALHDNVIDLDKVVEFIRSLQQDDGSFFGDKWGEIDVRFSFCAIAALKILKKENEIDLDKAINFVMKCNNFIDGGFGSRPGKASFMFFEFRTTKEV